MDEPKPPTLADRLKVAADFLEEHGFSPEVLVELREWKPPVPPPAPDPLNCFRLAIRDMPFGKTGGEVLGITLRIDSRMIEEGLMRSHDGNPVRLHSQLRYLVEGLSRQVEAALLKEIVRLGV